MAWSRPVGRTSGSASAPREDQTLPESAQRFGLLRKNSGQLLVTEPGPALDLALLAEGMTILGWAERGTRQPLDPSWATPHLIGGAGVRPLEGCGGPWGYEAPPEALAEPGHEEHEHLLTRVGGFSDSEAFDLAATNVNLELHDRHTRQRRMRYR